MAVQVRHGNWELTLVACVYDGELRLRSVEPTSDSGRGSFDGEFGEDILLILSGSTCFESQSRLFLTRHKYCIPIQRPLWEPAAQGRGMLIRHARLLAIYWRANRRI